MAFKIDDTLAQIVSLHFQTTRVAPFLAGEPGIGKTEFFKGLEHEGLVKVFSIDVNTLSDKGDLSAPRLAPNPSGDGWVQVFYPHATLVEAHEYAIEHPSETVVILLDEINRTDSDVTSSVLTLMTSRRAGNLTFAPNVRFAVTGNLSGNVTTLDSASLTRFALYEVKPDAQTFLDVMERKGVEVHPYITETLLANPEYIFAKPGHAVAATTENEEGEVTEFDMFSEEQAMTQYAAPRTIEGLNEWMTRIDEELTLELYNTEMITETGATTTALQLALRAQTGDTVFTDAIYDKYLTRFASPAAIVTNTITRPVAWDEIVKTETASAITEAVTNTSPEELDKVLVYALRISKKLSVAQSVISAIVSDERMVSIDQALQTELFRLGTAGQLNTSSLKYFFTLDTTPYVTALTPYKVVFGIN